MARESGLVDRNELGHTRRDVAGQQLGEELPEVVSEADWMEILDLMEPTRFGNNTTGASLSRRMPRELRLYK